MNGLTFRQLRYFEALARVGHFGRAAELCAVTQPALSMQIKELEDLLGVSLFERSARRVRLTSFGEEFAKQARQVLDAVEDLADLARVAQNRLVGRLRIGVIPTIAPYLLPRIVSGLNTEYPGLDFHIRETQTEKLLQELSDNQLDVAILALPTSEPTLTEVPLFRESFVLVRPEQDAGKPVPSVEGLKQMRLLLLEEGHCFRDQALSFCNMPSKTPREALDASALSTLVQMVAAGIGVTLLPEIAIPVETRSAAVVIDRFEDPQPQRQVGIVWRKSNPMRSQLLQIAEVLKEATTGLVTR